MKTLADLKLGEQGLVEGFKDEELSLKLMEMGCLPGTEISLKSKAPFGDPLLVQLSQSFISLRAKEAQTIILQS